MGVNFMNKLNDLLEKLARPLKDYSSCLLRIGLGVSFFLHGYGKVPIQQGFIDWLASKGIPFAELTAFLVAWGEMLAGIGIHSERSGTASVVFSRVGNGLSRGGVSE